jgi:hypothetical protein
MIVRSVAFRVRRRSPCGRNTSPVPLVVVEGEPLPPHALLILMDATSNAGFDEGACESGRAVAKPRNKAAPWRRRASWQ